MAQRILVIEDQAQQRGLVRLVLTHAGYEVVTAVSADDGLNIAASIRIDAALVDFFLPDQNGIELTENLRKLPGYRHLPIVMLSIEHDAGLRTLGERAGITCWLNKPVLAQELVDCMDRLLTPAVDDAGAGH